jgi:hypothetical protein
MNARNTVDRTDPQPGAKDLNCPRPSPGVAAGTESAWDTAPRDIALRLNIAVWLRPCSKSRPKQDGGWAVPPPSCRRRVCGPRWQQRGHGQLDQPMDGGLR